MTRHVILVASLMIPFTVPLQTARAQSEARVTARFNEIKRTYPCVDSTRIRVTVHDKKLLPMRCWLAGVVRAEIANGHAAEIAMDPSDTGVVLTATLTETRDILYAYGTNAPTPMWFWRLEVTKAGRRAPAVFLISQLDAAIHVTPYIQ